MTYQPPQDPWHRCGPTAPAPDQAQAAGPPWPARIWWARLGATPRAALILSVVAVPVLLCCAGVVAVGGTGDPPRTPVAGRDSAAAVAPPAVESPAPSTSPVAVPTIATPTQSPGAAQPPAARLAAPAPVATTQRPAVRRTTSRPATPRPPTAYYANCDAVRRAGKAPLHQGSPGFRPALDRDRDGVACESDEASPGGMVNRPPGGTDPRFATCGAATRAGYGPYHEGRDPEYAWYQDRDGDGVVCE